MIEKKSHKGLWTFLIILFVIIAFVLGFFVSKIILDSNKKVDKEEKKPTEIAVKSEKIEIAMNSLSKLSFNNEILYGKEKYEINSITDSELLATALKQMPFEYVGYCGDYLTKGPVTVDLINKYLKEVIYDKQITFDLIKKLAINYDEYYKVYETRIDPAIYIGLKGNDIYIGDNMCEGEPESDIVYKKAIKAEELDNTLYIYEKRAFYEESFETETVKYYSDPSLKNLVETKKAIVVEEFVFSTLSQTEDLDWDSYNTYKYTFKLIDGNYYFQSVELVK